MNYFSIGIHKKNVDLTAFFFISNVFSELEKGANKDINKANKHTDCTYLTPFHKATPYSANLPYSRRPRWIITCNFKEFYIYDKELYSDSFLVYT